MQTVLFTALQPSWPRYVFSQNKLYTPELLHFTGFSETHTLLISLELNHLWCYFLLFYQRIYKILPRQTCMELNHLWCHFLLFYQRIYKILPGAGPANMH